MRRRRFLALAGGTVGLAGCSAGDNDPGPSTVPSPTDGTATHTGTESPTATPTEADPVPAQSWPMLGHDHRNTRHNTDSVGPTNGIEVLWTFETDGAVRSSPAVVRGTVYIGSNDGYLYALDAETGEEQWAHETDGPVISSPAVLRNMVYVGSDDTHVYALSAATGEQQWLVDTGDRVRSSPTVAGDVDPAGIDEVVGIGSDDGSVYFLDAVSGDSLKTIQTDGPVVSSPVMYVTSGGVWEAGTGGTDGTSYWWIPEGQLGTVNTLPASAPVYAPMSVPDRFLENIWYRAHDDGTIEKRVFEGSNRAEWTFETGGSIRTIPVLADDFVYVASRDSTVYAIDRESGEQEWLFDTGGPVDSSPAVAGAAVYVGSADHRVYGLHAETGDTLWAYETGGPVVSSPAVVDGTVFVGSTDRMVYALAEPDG